MKLKQRRRLRATGAQQYVVAIPQVVQSPVFSRTIRYSATAAVSQGFTPLALLHSLGVVASAPLAVWPFCESFRLRRIDIYFTATTASGSVTPQGANVNFTASAPNYGNKSREVAATTMSTGEVTHLSATPRANEIAGMWNSGVNDTTTIFNLTCPANAVVDLSWSFTLNDNEDTPNALVIAGPASIGVVYYLSPDGVAGHKLVPTGLSSIS
jgi:hypothetical protein